MLIPFASESFHTHARRILASPIAPPSRSHIDKYVFFSATPTQMLHASLQDVLKLQNIMQKYKVKYHTKIWYRQLAGFEPKPF